MADGIPTIRVMKRTLNPSGMVMDEKIIEVSSDLTTTAYEYYEKVRKKEGW